MPGPVVFVVDVDCFETVRFANQQLVLGVVLVVFFKGCIAGGTRWVLCVERKRSQVG